MHHQFRHVDYNNSVVLGRTCVFGPASITHAQLCVVLLVGFVTFWVGPPPCLQMSLSHQSCFVFKLIVFVNSWYTTRQGHGESRVHAIRIGIILLNICHMKVKQPKAETGLYNFFHYYYYYCINYKANKESRQNWSSSLKFVLIQVVQITFWYILVVQILLLGSLM